MACITVADATVSRATRGTKEQQRSFTENDINVTLLSSSKRDVSTSAGVSSLSL